jgi:1-deoxy-D-xylulose-5-phosphate reductoisomerase
VSNPRQITILGATGSIGQSTLDVVARHPDRYRVFALTAQRSLEQLAAQCRQHRPRYAVVADAAAADSLRGLLDGQGVEVLAGAEALAAVSEAPEVDAVMAAIVGAAGLLPSLAAARAGKRVLLANKEALVLSGQLFMDAVAASGAELLPIDSEHNAVFQCLPPRLPDGLAAAGVARITLTASGGPFRNTPLAELEAVTPAQAVAHPNWSMGRKISVDSATMMNKGLEFIEACWLFAATSQQVEVVIHPQSIIHSMVSYTDGSTLAQLGNPDMRTPIAHALAWPERFASGVDLLDLVKVGRLDFQTPDEQRFPCLALARAAWEAGGTATAVLNAANEVAVEAFLDGRLGFTGIARLVEATLERCRPVAALSLETVLAADEEARATAREWLSRKAA